MKPRDVILVQLEFAFGSKGKSLLKEKVNEALDNGEWQEDFDIAVTGNKLELENEEAEKLLKAVFKAYPNYFIDIKRLGSLINKYLPQSKIGNISWIVGPDLDIVVEDSFRVAKFHFDTLIWVTKRISWDGIILDNIKNDTVYGKWYDYSKYDGEEWQPLKLSYSDGSIIEGTELEDW